MNVERPVDIPEIIPEEEDDDALLAEARADVAAGRGVPHEEVMAWVRTWGTTDERPMPPEWLA